MALSFFLWNFLLLFVIATVITRNLFAWSVDRILPDAVTKVDRRFHSPWVATLIVIVASEILLVLYVFTTFFQEVSNYIVLYSIAFWATSFAAILLPYRRPEIYQSAPAFVRRKVGGVPVLVLFGVGNFILFSLVLYSAFKLPAFSGPTGTRRGAVRGRHLRRWLAALHGREGDPEAARHRHRSRLQGDPAGLMRIFYASDVHASNRCFKKFLNAGKFYGSDALVLGGDITGKAIVPFVEQANGEVHVTFLGKRQVLTTEEEVRVRRAARR